MKKVICGFILVSLVLSLNNAAGSTSVGTSNFVNTPLILPNGSSEPAVTIGNDGTMVLSALSWETRFTNIWKSPFGSIPNYQGQIDASIGVQARNSISGLDADIDLGSTGTLHATTLVAFLSPVFPGKPQLGVSSIACPNADTSGNFVHCTTQVIDTTMADRQWITSDGLNVYISYHDPSSSGLIHVQRSDDDGFTWHRVGDPIIGQGIDTANATFNNDQGPIVADPTTHDVYAIYSAGVTGLQKATTANHNNIYVSRSTDKGKSWTKHLVYSAPVNTPLNNVFPALAVDPKTGILYAVWSDAHNLFFSMSTDQGSTWSKAIVANTAPANTVVLPWLSAYNGIVDLVYYGTDTSSKDDPNAIWNVYMAQTKDNGAHFVQSIVTDHPNHIGVICTSGTGCSSGTRNLLDLFEVSINPQNGMAAIIYTDDTLTTTSSGAKLPQVAIAQQG